MTISQIAQYRNTPSTRQAIVHHMRVWKVAMTPTLTTRLEQNEASHCASNLQAQLTFSSKLTRFGVLLVQMLEAYVVAAVLRMLRLAVLPSRIDLYRVLACELAKRQFSKLLQLFIRQLVKERRVHVFALS
jgi:hypothetical protein